MIESEEGGDGRVDELKAYAVAPNEYAHTSAKLPNTITTGEVTPLCGCCIVRQRGCEALGYFAFSRGVAVVGK